MTSDLSRAQLESGQVVRVERFGALVEISVVLPHLASTAAPGQFAQVRCGPGPVPLLRRPFSVAWVDGDVCAFVFEEVGTGTRLLGRLAPGDDLEVLGPLGHGFTLESSLAGCVIVSGGVGCAPFPLLIKRLLEQGVDDIVVLSGASTAHRLYPASRFGRGAAIDVRETTDDGTRAVRGLVTQLLRDVTTHGRPLYACGPNRMLAALWDVLDGDGRPLVEASLEAPMGCGFGTCLGCALPVRSGESQRWALCCTAGPVMAMSSVDWAAVGTLPAADVA